MCVMGVLSILLWAGGFQSQVKALTVAVSSFNELHISAAPRINNPPQTGGRQVWSRLGRGVCLCVWWVGCEMRLGLGVAHMGHFSPKGCVGCVRGIVCVCVWNVCQGKALVRFGLRGHPTNPGCTVSTRLQTFNI